MAREEKSERKTTTTQAEEQAYQSQKFHRGEGLFLLFLPFSLLSFLFLHLRSKTKQNIDIDEQIYHLLFSSSLSVRHTSSYC